MPFLTSALADCRESPYRISIAGVAELVDALDLGSSELACAGSSPVPGILFLNVLKKSKLDDVKAEDTPSMIDYIVCSVISKAESA